MTVGPRVPPEGERGSEPARYEDKLRARPALTAYSWSAPAKDRGEVKYTPLLESERDALADAVEALRALRRETGHVDMDRWDAWADADAHADSALARLDGLGG